MQKARQNPPLRRPSALQTPLAFTPSHTCSQHQSDLQTKKGRGRAPPEPLRHGSPSMTGIDDRTFLAPAAAAPVLSSITCADTLRLLRTARAVPPKRRCTFDKVDQVRAESSSPVALLIALNHRQRTGANSTQASTSRRANAYNNDNNHTATADGQGQANICGAAHASALRRRRLCGPVPR